MDGIRSAWRRFLGPLLFLVLGTGCVSPRTEQEIGDTIAGDVNQQLPLIQDQVLLGYLGYLGSAVAPPPEEGEPVRQYSFYILNTPEVNAFALPGGHIYVTRGLLIKTQNEAELAGVLAHEIGHVNARHGVQKLERQLRTGTLMGMLYRLFLGGEPEWMRNNSLQLAATAWNARHSRAAEDEADRLAVEYLLEAGVNPIGIVTLLETLRGMEKADSSGLAGWFSTHPLTQERIRKVSRTIQEEAQGKPLPEEAGIGAYPAFLRRVATLPPLEGRIIRE